ncbi:MAG TPA: EamA family transporter [Gammaproteobacteria bacterium]|nr:EamA family transporter [Gammaproteobacteria bacterium]
MAIILALLAAFAYGASDFAGGLGSRKSNAGLATAIVQFFGLIMALAAIWLLPSNNPSAAVLGWGAVSGIGSAIGALALYRGMVVGRMSVVAPLSAVTTAVIPVVLGLFLGESLAISAQIGIALAIPAIALVALHPEPGTQSNKRAGILEGIVSGVGFALLFIALDQAGTQYGAWPLVPGQTVAILLVLPFAWQARRQPRPASTTMWLLVAGGVCGGGANLLFLAATGYGQLAIVTVLTALYPAITILLARVFLHERLQWLQIVGLFLAAGAVVLLSL